jgi:hypothetical protein
MHEFGYIFFSINFILYKAFSIMIVAALSAIGGALPLIGLLYIYFKYRKQALEKYISNYEKDKSTEEKKLSIFHKIIQQFSEQGITLDTVGSLYTARPEKLQSLPEPTVIFILNTFWENQNGLWDTEQKINSIENKISYIKELNFTLFIGTFLNKKYSLDIKY